MLLPCIADYLKVAASVCLGTLDSYFLIVQ